MSVEIALRSPKTLEQRALALPRHLTAERFARVALTEVRKNPMLAECDSASFLSALVQAAQLGLEIGSALGHAYLIPFRNTKKGIVECQLVTGYKGKIELARRSGQIKRLSAHVVYDGDKFEYCFGSEEYVRHTPCGNTNPTHITHGYAIAEFKDGAVQQEVMTRREIDAIRDRGRKNPVWDSDYAEMARKTLINRIAKYLPQSPEMADAIRIDNEADELFATPVTRTPHEVMRHQIDAGDDENQKNNAAIARAEAELDAREAATQ